MNDPRSDLQEALDELRRRATSKQVPDRQLVRLAFVALGRIDLEEGEAAARPLAKELAAAALPHEERWTEAVDSELSLAVAEHVHSADPHYLELPGYDFAYAIAARERLEARLRAAELLGLPVAEGLLDQVTAADERLQPFLERES
jgi:hypothetical protein